VSAIALDRITKVYDGDVRAVDEVSLDVADGELLVLLGPSGCGKTTLLRLIAGLEDITSGELTLNGQRATAVEAGDRNVAMVFQHSALYPHLTVRENLAFPLLTAGSTNRQAVDARVSEIAYGMGLDHQLDRRPGTLSGGEKQRVAMGRALILRGPTVLLMDEPLASLDVGTRNGLRAEIRALIRALRLTTIYVTHDQAEALSLADRIAVLRDGAVEDVGTPVRIYEEPATAFVAAFLGSPQINLAWATVSVHAGDRVVIDFAEQQVELPWTDPRCADLAPYDGQPVIVGIRPDALTPVRAEAVAGQNGRAPAVRVPKPRGRVGRQPDTRPDPVLRGRISALEYYGHEWLGRLDAGLRSVDLDRLRTEPGPPVPQGGRRGGHRGASLLIRLDAPRGWAAGQDVGVSVDLSRVLLFDASGRRIGPPRAADPPEAPGVSGESAAPEAAEAAGTKEAAGAAAPARLGRRIGRRASGARSAAIAAGGSGAGPADSSTSPAGPGTSPAGPGTPPAGPGPADGAPGAVSGTPGTEAGDPAPAPAELGPEAVGPSVADGGPARVLSGVGTTNGEPGGAGGEPGAPDDEPGPAGEEPGPSST
jgi:multiple sugar transport system ATP-binding protein